MPDHVNWPEARATLRAVRGADAKMWTTEDLNLWDGSGPDASNVGLVEAGKHVLVTGRRENDRAEVVIGGAEDRVFGDEAGIAHRIGHGAVGGVDDAAGVEGGG